MPFGNLYIIIGVLERCIYIKNTKSFFNSILIYQLSILVLAVLIIAPLLFNFLENIGLDGELAERLSGGITIGSIPLVFGFIKDRIKLGIWGLVFSIAAEFVWGMSLSICVLCIYMDKINKIDSKEHYT